MCGRAYRSYNHQMARPTLDSEFAVIGLGRFGSSVARTLIEHGRTVLGIDRDMRIVQELADDLTQTVALDSTDEDALRAVDITLYPTVVVALGADFHDNILTTLALKKLGVKRVICMASDERDRTILLRVGADDVVMPDNDSGRRLALTLSMPTLTNHLPLSGGYSVSEVRLPTSYVSKTVGAVDLRAAFGLTLVAVLRAAEVIVSPPADLAFRAGDRLIVIGRTSDLDRLGEIE